MFPFFLLFPHPISFSPPAPSPRNSPSLFSGESRGLLLTRNLIFTIFACIISRTGVHSTGISSRDEARGTRGRRESKAFFICERGINPATRDELFHDLPFLRGRVILPPPPSHPLLAFSLFFSSLRLSSSFRRGVMLKNTPSPGAIRPHYDVTPVISIVIHRWLIVKYIATAIRVGDSTKVLVFKCFF